MLSARDVDTNMQKIREITSDEKMIELVMAVMETGVRHMTLGGSWAVGKHATTKSSDVDFMVCADYNALCKIMNLGFTDSTHGYGSDNGTRSLKCGLINLVFTYDLDLAKRGAIAARLSSYLNLTEKKQRCAVFHAVVFGEAYIHDITD